MQRDLIVASLIACPATTFNPSYIGVQGGNKVAGVIVRTDQCGDTNNSLSFAPCDLQTGTCGDLQSGIQLPPDQGTQDPRIVFYNGQFYNFAYGSNPKQAAGDNCTDGLCTVILSKTATPLVADSWEHIGTYPWHRNGCCTMKPKGERSFCIFGEGPGPLPGLGIAYTTDIDEGRFIQANWSSGVAPGNEMWLEPLGAAQQEIKLEAGTHIQTLSTGDYIHFYAAATPGWVR